jgi:hypothetical protein
MEEVCTMNPDVKPIETLTAECAGVANATAVACTNGSDSEAVACVASLSVSAGQCIGMHQ